VLPFQYLLPKPTMVILPQQDLGAGNFRQGSSYKNIILRYRSEMTQRDLAEIRI
jgi:hypothetical protein